MSETTDTTPCADCDGLGHFLYNKARCQGPCRSPRSPADGETAPMLTMGEVVVIPRPFGEEASSEPGPTGRITEVDVAARSITVEYEAAPDLTPDEKIAAYQERIAYLEGELASVNDEDLLHSDACSVLCRVFDDGADEGMEEWHAWYKPEEWLHGYRALGAFIAQRLKSRAAAPRSGPDPLRAAEDYLRSSRQQILLEALGSNAFTAALVVNEGATISRVGTGATIPDAIGSALHPREVDRESTSAS